MILHGNQCGGAKDLALHLMKDENETVQVYDVRGFISRDVMGAFTESYAMSRATKCKQHLYSLSLNPPKDTDVSDRDFVDAVEMAEQRLGLSKQPRVIVFHEKYGDDGQLRKHAHAVWSRIDTHSSPGRMKAVQLSYTKRKLQDVSRELYIRHGWTMPRGFIDPNRRDPKNFTLAEWQQAKRQGKDPKAVKAIFQDSWAVSDGIAGFRNALAERGFILAKGDRRGFVAVDHTGEVYAVARWVGVKTKIAREKLGEPDDLPSVQHAHARAAQIVAQRLRQLKVTQRHKVDRFKVVFAQRRNALEAKRAAEKTRLETLQSRRKRREEEQRQARIRRGLLGLLDRFTGRRRKMEALNTQEAAAALKRDALQRSRLFQRHHDRIQALNADDAQKQARLNAVEHELRDDIRWLENVPDMEKAGSSKPDQSPDFTTRSRDGPNLEI